VTRKSEGREETYGFSSTFREAKEQHGYLASVEVSSVGQVELV